MNQQLLECSTGCDGSTNPCYTPGGTSFTGGSTTSSTQALWTVSTLWNAENCTGSPQVMTAAPTPSCAAIDCLSSGGVSESTQCVYETPSFDPTQYIITAGFGYSILCDGIPTGITAYQKNACINLPAFAGGYYTLYGCSGTNITYASNCDSNCVSCNVTGQQPPYCFGGSCTTGCDGATNQCYTPTTAGSSTAIESTTSASGSSAISSTHTVVPSEGSKGVSMPVGLLVGFVLAACVSKPSFW